jgi:hypothetical protein
VSRNGGPSSHEFTRAVGDGASTQEVAAKLRITVTKARKGLTILRGLTILIEDRHDHWVPFDPRQDRGGEE